MRDSVREIKKEHAEKKAHTRKRMGKLKVLMRNIPKEGAVTKAILYDK